MPGSERNLLRQLAILFLFLIMGGLVLPVRGSMAQGAGAASATVKPGTGQPQPSPEQQKAAQDWFPLEKKCMEAVKAQALPEAVDLCKQTLDMSMQAGDLTSSDQLARIGSHQLYGHALLLAGKKQAALAQEYMAVDEAHKCLTDKDQEYAMPYFWRGVVEANMGQNDAALADYATAEATHRKAIADLP